MLSPVTQMDETLASEIGSGTLVKTLEGAAALGRLGTVTDIASVVAFLASPDSAFITGMLDPLLLEKLLTFHSRSNRKCSHPVMAFSIFYPP